MKTWFLLAISCLYFSSSAMGAENFPRQNLLVEADEFPKSVIVLDARPQKAYEATHIPGAVWVDHAAWSKSFGDGDDSEAWSKRIGELGIDGRGAVVVYDDSSFKDSARIWWILRYWGVPHARLLDGLAGGEAPCGK